VGTMTAPIRVFFFLSKKDSRVIRIVTLASWKSVLPFGLLPGIHQVHHARIVATKPANSIAVLAQ